MAKKRPSPRKRRRAKNYHEKRKRRHTSNRNKINIIKGHYGCQICGEKFIPCLSFHHLQPDLKRGTIGDLVKTVGRPTTGDEICMCVVLCLNCHVKVENNALTLTEPYGKRCKVDSQLNLILKEEDAENV